MGAAPSAGCADEKAEGAVVGGHGAVVVVAVVPCAVGEVGGEGGDEAGLGFGSDKAPGALGAADVVVEEHFGAGVEGFGEEVGAVDGKGDGVDGGIGAEGGGDVGEGLEAVALGVDEFGGVVGEPEAVEGVAVEGHDDDGAAGDAPEFGDATAPVGPLVDGQDGHGGVDGLIVERK